MQWRFAYTDEIGDVARLVAHSFPGATRTPVTLEAQLRDPVYGGGADTLLIGLDGTRIVAACQVHPLQQWIGGAALACAGVGTVAIAPTHRRRRLGAELVTRSLHAARERGDVASALYPFRVGFYQQLGYGQADEALQYQVAPGMLRDAPDRADVELLDTDAQRSEALRLYGRWARTQTGQLERTERLWTSLLTPHDTALVGCRGADGALDGYARVVYRTEPPPRVLDVEELVWTTPHARRALTGWLASLGDQWPQLIVRALPSHRLGDWIREPRLPRGAVPTWGLWAPAAALMAGTMFRIVDVQRVWPERRVHASSALAVRLEVVDAQLESNAGGWRLALEDGRADVTRGGDAACTLRLDVATLSRIFIGALAPTAALRSELLECDRPELLPPVDAALALPEPWTFDRF